MLKENFRDPIAITTEQWVELLADRTIIQEKDLRVLHALYSFEGKKATAKQLAAHLQARSAQSFNIQVPNMAKRIVAKLDIEPPQWHHQEKFGPGINWWHVPFWGDICTEGVYWILRPELVEALSRRQQ